MRTQRPVWMGVMILACVGGSHLKSDAQAPLPQSSSAAPSVPGSGGAQAVTSQMQALAAQIASLTQELRALLQQLDQLRSSQPQPPPTDAPPATKTAYANARQAWEIQVQAAEQRIQVLQARIHALDQELARLASQQLPAAYKADYVKQQQALAETKKMLSQAMATAASLNPRSGKSGVKPGTRLPSPSTGLP